MYIHAMLKQGGIRALNSLQLGQQNHSRLFPLALGYVLAAQLPLPSYDTEDIRIDFRLQNQITVEATISKINELLPHDSAQTLEDVKSFFFYRHSAANPPKIPLSFNEETAIVSFFGIANFFSGEVLCCISTRPTELTNLISQLTLLVADLETPQQTTDLPHTGLLNQTA